jgi:hypothetical protein
MDFESSFVGGNCYEATAWEKKKLATHGHTELGQENEVGRSSVSSMTAQSTACHLNDCEVLRGEAAYAAGCSTVDIFHCL